MTVLRRCHHWLVTATIWLQLTTHLSIPGRMKGWVGLVKLCVEATLKEKSKDSVVTQMRFWWVTKMPVISGQEREPTSSSSSSSSSSQEVGVRRYCGTFVGLACGDRVHRVAQRRAVLYAATDFGVGVRRQFRSKRTRSKYSLTY